MKLKSPFSHVRKSILMASLFLPPFVCADTFVPAQLQTSQMDFGGVGLMQMPSARMAPEGELSIGGSFNDDYYHGTISLQVMPWAEATVRYTTISSLRYSADSDTDYTDKGIDFKIRLLKEGNWLPETSVGLRDIGGTGLFDGEFIAATKRFANLDFTLGMGWGYLGQSGNVSNPFCSVSDSYCSRSDNSTNGGTIEYNTWFTGPTALFGGIEYQTPYQPLRLKVEYDSNDYSEDKPVTSGGVDMTQYTPWNFGVLYNIKDWADLKLSYERGDTFTLGFTLHTNFDDMKPAWRDIPEPTFQPGVSADNPNWNQLANQLKSNAGYQHPEISTSKTNITVKGEVNKYRDPDVAHKRAGLLLSQVRSPDVDTYTFVETNKGMAISQTQYDADKFDAFANHGYIGAKLDDAKLTDLLPEDDQESVPLNSLDDNFNYGFSPTLSQTIGSEETFYFYALGVTANSGYRIASNLELSGSLYFNFTDNYDQYDYVEDSPYISNFSVPRVRTLFRYYVHDHPVRMNNLQLTWFDKLSDNIYLQGYAGYLESMFAGVGGEILYRPKNTNWAIGVDANLISQRDPDNWFSTYSEDYFEFDGGCDGGSLTTSCAAYVLSKGETGFLNIYYKPQWSLLKNTLWQANIGKFLGQDKGVRFDVSKQFDSGVVTGVYASFTDLSSDEYGEGSFTKGFYVSIPFDIMTVKPSRNRAVVAWQPLTRDGGQKLNRKYQLYEVTDGRSPWFTRPISED